MQMFSGHTCAAGVRRECEAERQTFILYIFVNTCAAESEKGKKTGRSPDALQCVPHFHNHNQDIFKAFVFVVFLSAASFGWVALCGYVAKFKAQFFHL